MAAGQWRGDIESTVSSALSFNPAARTATANGTGVDLQNFMGAMVVVTIGTITDGTHTLKLQDSPDNSAWTDVAAANLSGSFTALTSGSVAGTTQEVSYLGNQRYIRAVTTVSGTTTGGVYGAVVIRAFPRTQPVT